MDTVLAKKPHARSHRSADYCSPDYWNGLIKMSMSKFFVLSVLNQGPMHGYEITKRVKATSNGCCSPTPGALYPVLHEFEEGSYVTTMETIVHGRTRKVYTITDKGREAFQVGVKVWMDVGRCVIASAEGSCDENGRC